MSKKHILLIDDEKHISTVVKACLVTLGGWDVSTANSGREGLLKAQQQPDAILLDVMMPDMNGITLLQELRKEPKTQNIPVLLLTAKAQTSDHHEYTHLDIAGVITKPFEPLKLADQIAEVLGWH
jgi:CheY-like chemotaxis protein